MNAFSFVLWAGVPQAETASLIYQGGDWLLDYSGVTVDPVPRDPARFRRQANTLVHIGRLVAT
jgi:hypothetical protein